MDAYEALCSEWRTMFKALSERFAPYRSSVPSDSISPTEAHECAIVFVKQGFDEADVEGFGVRVHGAGESPEKLRDAAYAVALFYYLGWWDLAYSHSIAVAGEGFDGVDDGRPRNSASPASIASCRVPVSNRASATPNGAAQEGNLAPARPIRLAANSQPVTSSLAVSTGPNPPGSRATEA